MQDFALTAPTEQDLIAALPEYRVSTEDGEQWNARVIQNCTRWITRPQYDEDGNLTNTPETVPGFTLILYADDVPDAAQTYVVVDPGDIEPVPAGGLKSLDIPQVVSRFQARAALYQFGVLESVELLMQDPETPTLARLAWQDAQAFERQSPTVAAMSSALGLTESQLDALFISAAKITA